MKVSFECIYGDVTVRTVMFDIDGTNLEEGIEISGEGISTIELYGDYDLSELTVEEVEELINSNL